jgi:hypothetical protein
VIDGFVKKIERVPLLNIAGGIIQDYQYLWENYYFPSNPLPWKVTNGSCVVIRSVYVVIWIKHINKIEVYLIEMSTP